MSAPTTPPPHPDPTVPQVRLPPLSCDSHCHVFGPAAVFPFSPNRTFTPVDVPKERLRALHDLLGLQRAVIVQSACHGTDHSALLDALEAGQGRYRGVALITPSTSPEDIDKLAAAGVCGFRVNFLPHLGDAPSAHDIHTMIDLVAPHGWHVEIHVAGTGAHDHAELIRSLPAPVVIDHLARVDLAGGLESEPISALLGLLDTGRVWVKLSGVDRISQEPGYRDGAALARRLLRHAPDRVLWGTDFPHPNISGPMPDDGHLLELVSEIAQDPRELTKLMVENPAEFFGFD